MKSKPTWIMIILLIFLLLPNYLFSYSYLSEFNPSTYICEFQIPNYHIDEFLFSPPYSDEENKENLIKLASDSLSSMIFGCDFVFVPNSYLNQVEQEFSYTHKGRIDPQQIKIQTQTKNPELTLSVIHYSPNPYEKSKREFWRKAKAWDSHGKATISMREGKDIQQVAIDLAIKDAIIGLYKKDLIGKPRMIEGSFILVEAPLLGIVSGEWVAKVKIRLQTAEIAPYYP